MFKKITTFLTALVIGICATSPALADGEAESTGLTRPGHSQEELLNYRRSYKTKATDTEEYMGLELINPNGKQVYEERFTDDGTKEGKLSSYAYEDSLHIINTMRYMAGLDEVTYSAENNFYAQRAAYINYLNGGINHYPECPEVLSENSDMYIDGAIGSNKSNLSMGFGASLNQIVSYMQDSDNYNSQHLGHRRWILNAGAEDFGIGAVDGFGALFVIGKGHFGEDEVVAWPNGATFGEVIESSGTPWSILLGINFAGMDKNKITVSVKDLDSQEVKTYTKSNGLIIDDEILYGHSTAMIFGSDLDTSVGKNYQVTVEGLDKNGTNYPISYKTQIISAGGSSSTGQENNNDEDSEDNEEDIQKQKINNLIEAMKKNDIQRNAAYLLLTRYPNMVKNFRTDLIDLLEKSNELIKKSEDLISKITGEEYHFEGTEINIDDLR